MSEEARSDEIDPRYRGYVTNRLLTTSRPLVGDDYPEKLAKYNLTDDHATAGELEYLGLKLEDLPEGRILDVGIGGGRSFLQALQLGIDIYAVDLALKARVGAMHPGALAQAREHIVLTSLRAIKEKYPQRFVEADAAQRIPFADDYFSMVIACVSLPHYARNPHEAVNSIMEMIRVGRDSVVFTCNYASIPEGDQPLSIGIGDSKFRFRLAGFLNTLESYGIKLSWTRLKAFIVAAHLDISQKDKKRLNSERQLLLNSAQVYLE